MPNGELRPGSEIPVGATVGWQASSKAAPKPYSKDWWKQRLVNFEEAATEALPAAGATAGAIIGGTAGTVAGPLGTASGGIGGAGLGGMGGEALKQLIRRGLGWEAPQTAGEAASAITKAGLVQAGVQVPAEVLPTLRGPLARLAETQYARALAPTTRYTKATAQDIVPGLIERGERGSLESLGRRAAGRAAELSPELRGEYGALEARSPLLPVRGARGRFQPGVTGQLPRSGEAVLKDLDALKSKYMVPDAAGKLQVANQQAVDAIEGVKATVRKFGPNVSPTSLRQLKQIFDEPVAHAGGYAGADLATHYTLNAQEAAANSIRKVLHDASPSISELDKEVSFWLDVQLVTSRTLERQTGQAGGLVKALSPLAGLGAAGIGLHYGGAAGGIEAGLGTSMMVLGTQMIRSPLWRTTSAVFKDRMAGALARGDVKQLSALAMRLGIAARTASRGTEQ